MSGRVAVVVVAAGRGARAGLGAPKQYRFVGGEPILRQTLSLFSTHPQVSQVQPVIHPNDRALFDAAAAGLAVMPPVSGGATRQASVRAGLEALAAAAAPPDLVLVHDGARPFASPALVSRAIAALAQADAAVPALALADTIKAIDGGRIVKTLDRSALRAIQTPQAFRFAALLDLHCRAAAAGIADASDDASLAERFGIAVDVFEGETGNVKLTTEIDFIRAEAVHVATLGDVRTASGLDVHAFGDGDHVMLGGIRIPHRRGLAGHSDADVVLHALVDAILGALSEGDIGMHFPSGEARWRGVSSAIFLSHAVERVRARGGRIAHLDVSIVCEKPAIAPHRDAMRARIAEIAGIPVERVAVKATTSEKLGFTGREEGILALANATIRLPWSDL
jgi:2-C-methyl-D-erythritol 4-phosphate cytidylyltransferase/2-C-methyl-D-erythritol 2,4-cyclodiphosphate synthase